jgi:hypothetical protein
MMEGRMEEQTLARRLEKLEKLNRRLRIGVGAVLLVVASLFLMGQAPPQSKTIEAQEFILRDANNKQRAKLSLVEDTTVLSLYDANENVRARLVAGDRPGLLFFDAGRTGPYANVRLALGVGDMGGGAGDSGPHFLLFDANGRGRAELFVTQNRLGLFFYDANGKVLFKAP